MRQTYEPILDAYRDKGYVDARIETSPQLDATTHTVTYAISVVPGEPYTVSAVHFDGLSGEFLNTIQQNWKLKPGTVFNPSYAHGFLRANTALFMKQRYSETYDMRADPATHTVDLTAHFFPIQE